LQQRCRLCRQRPVTIHQLGAQRLDLGRLEHAGDALVDLHLLFGIGHVAFGNQVVGVDLDLRRDLLGNLAALHLGHRLLEQLAVQLEADRHQMPVLLQSEDVASATDLEVAHRDLEARAQGFEFLQHRQALAGQIRRRAAARHHEIGIGLVRRAPDAATQLVQLRQPQPVRRD
jgi:hypothetical protein